MSKQRTHTFAIWFCIAIELIVIIFYGVFVRWGPNTDYSHQDENETASKDHSQTYYPLYQDVHVMMFIGFGFLMTYLRHHSWSSVSINFLIAVFAIQLYILMNGFWDRVFGVDSWHEYIHITTKKMITADFGAAAVLISFGGVMGKVNAYQMLVITLLEVFFYSLNEVIVYQSLSMSDAGGSTVIHTFGAYFGLTATYMITTHHAKDHPRNTSHYTSNLFAMIGTIFLWMFWPSFNSAVVPVGNAQMRTQITTVFSLIGSCFSTFMVTALYKKGKFHMEDILNSTLAGGVMIGASADICQYPFAAFIVGIIGGTVSTVSFEQLGHFLQKKIGLYDTAGIHNLHGIPGLLGGFSSAIFAAAMTKDKLGYPVSEYFTGRTASEQAGFQIAGTFVSLGIAIGTGIITGIIARMQIWNPPSELFTDKVFWEMESDEEHAHAKIQARANIVPSLKLETMNSNNSPSYRNVELTDRNGEVTDRDRNLTDRGSAANPSRGEERLTTEGDQGVPLTGIKIE